MKEVDEAMRLGKGGLEREGVGIYTNAKPNGRTAPR